MNTVLGEYINHWENEEKINYLIHGYSEVILDSVDSINEFNKLNGDKENEIIEVRLFNNKKELFIYKCDNEWKRVLTIHDAETEQYEHFDKEYVLEKRFNKKEKYESIKVRKYIDYEDDLAYVRKTCLFKLTKGDNNGKK